MLSTQCEVSASDLQSQHIILIHWQCEMDQKVVMKEEPVWLEEKVNTTLENFELVSEMKPLKQETYSDLTEPGPAQKDSFEILKTISGTVCIFKSTSDGIIPFRHAPD
ncbi:uncharacterized protein [Anabrus simplex]|uniref:uncharacterized protein isoform X2 n=1 Tax=Anabrus simplex TaxID=316456 RepID=UPI0035A2A9CE